MTTQVHLRPLLGVGADDPLCSVLEVDGATLLLDCGCTERFDLASLEPLRPVARRADLVLLSHPDLAHLGGLAYAYGRLGLRCPVYATLPVWRMGQMFMYDAYQSRAGECGGEVEGFDLDDVDAAFAHVTQLKYSQQVRPPGVSLQGLTITPLPAGRTLGGAVWRICKEAETVVYAVDLSHRTERLFPASCLQHLHRPTALITCAHPASRDPGVSSKQRGANIVDAVVRALRAGASVLVPTDSAARSLELLRLLDVHWQSSRLKQYPIAFLGHTSWNALEFAKAQMEWMTDAVVRAFDQSGQPLAFKHISPCVSPEEVADLGEGPKVVCVSTESCDMGLSRAALLEWLGDEDRLVILTSTGAPDSVARRLVSGRATPDSILIPRWEEQALVGDALEAWRARREAARALAFAAAAAAPEAADAAPGAHGDMEIDEAEEAEEAEGGLPAASQDAATVVERLGRLTAVSAYPLMQYQDKFPRRDAWGEEVPEAEWGHMAQVAEVAARKTYDGSARMFSGQNGGGDTAPGRRAKIGKGVVDRAEGEDDAGEEDMDSGRPRPGLVASRRAAAAQSTAAVGAGVGDAGDAAADEAAPERPTHWVERSTTVAVRCQVLHADWQGDCNAPAFRALVRQVAPTTLCLLRGSPADKVAARAAAARADVHRVFTPGAGEVVDLGSHVALRRLRMPDIFLRGLSFKAIGPYEVARVQASVRGPTAGALAASPGAAAEVLGAPASLEGCRALVPAAETDGEEAVRAALPAAAGACAHSSGTGALAELHPRDVADAETAEDGTVVPRDRACAVTSQAMSFVSQEDLRLSKFKQTLTKAGFAAEFDSGVLVVNGLVRLCKMGPGKVAINGMYGADYVAVRELLFEQFHRL